MSGDPVGMLVVDKPAGRTSHDVVAAVRRRLGCRAGHTGTLDPQATGVLLVCLGGTTRLARFLQHQDKLYECGIRLGWATDTYDRDGEPVGERVEPPTLDTETVEEALRGFLGTIDQVPPVYSAKKIRGQPAYRRARRGEEVVHEPVEVVIHDLRLLAIGDGSLTLRVHCGSGTYVRTLAHDLGARLGCPAHLESLRRLQVGRFDFARAVAWETVVDGTVAELEAAVVPPQEMLPEWPGVTVTAAGIDLVRNGGVLEPRTIVERIPGAGGAVRMARGDWVRVLAPDGRMVAAAETLSGGVLQPRVVLV